jgi:hypothetical protein
MIKNIDLSDLGKGLLKEIIKNTPEIIIMKCDACDSMTDFDKDFYRAHNLPNEYFCNKFHEAIAQKLMEKLLREIFGK